VPAKQRGSVDKPGPSWRARWSDVYGKRRERRGFSTKTEARSWLRDEVDSVFKQRRNLEAGSEPPVPTSRRKFAEADVTETARFSTANGGEQTSSSPEKVSRRLSGPLMKVHEVAAQLRISTRWVYEQALAYDRGDPRGLPSVRFGTGKRRPVRFDRRDVEAWLERHRSREDRRSELALTDGTPAIVEKVAEGVGT
jgi:hypothetical protein